MTTGQAKRALNNLNTVAKRVDTNVSNLKSPFSKIGASLVSINAAFSVAKGVFNAVAGSIVDVIDASNKQRDAINKLNTAIETAGDTADDISPKFQQFASDLQDVTKYGDETTLEMMALGINMGIPLNKIEEATTAAADMASAVGIDLRTAMRLMGKAAIDGGSGLRRYGVDVEKGTTKTESLNNAIEAAREQFAGAAESEAETLSGQIQQLSNSFGDLQETIGDKLNPILKTSTGYFKELIDAANEFLGESDVEERIREINKELLSGNTFSNFGGGMGTGARMLTKEREDALRRELKILKQDLAVEEGRAEVQTFITDQSEQMSKMNEEQWSMHETALEEQRELEEKRTKEKQDNIEKETKLLEKQVDEWDKFSKKTLEAAKNMDDEVQSLSAFNRIKAGVNLSKEQISLFQSGVSTISGGGAAIKSKVSSMLMQSGNPYAMAGGAAIEIFGKSKEDFKKFTDSIVDVAAELPVQMAENIPYFIERFIEEIPYITEGVIESIPIIIEKLAEMLGSKTFWSNVAEAAAKSLTSAFEDPATIVKIAESAAKAMFDGIVQGFKDATDEIVQTIKNWFTEALDGLTGGTFSKGGDFLNSVVSAPGNVLSAVGGLFADGGIVGGNSYTGDRLLARVNSGEMVLNKSQQQELFKQINSGGNSSVSDAIFELGNRIANLEIKLVANDKEIARSVNRAVSDGYIIGAN